ncbi:hypothetical protein L6452_32658 [Arctium lappa]|uniref:Uncharacterized protein n=1 Tax=Arctium lappa TaxID=4217 RepID=A0ACB8Z4A8_ARCLA|nr:hypothetical protein L6452_32658 [Arctium lappa]
MVSEGGGKCLCMILVGLLSMLTTEGYDVGLTFLDSVVAKGADMLMLLVGGLDLMLKIIGGVDVVSFKGYKTLVLRQHQQRCLVKCPIDGVAICGIKSGEKSRVIRWRRWEKTRVITVGKSSGEKRRRRPEERLLSKAIGDGLHLEPCGLYLEACVEGVSYPDPFPDLVYRRLSWELLLSRLVYTSPGFSLLPVPYIGLLVPRFNLRVRRFNPRLPNFIPVFFSQT